MNPKIESKNSVCQVIYVPFLGFLGYINGYRGGMSLLKKIGEMIPLVLMVLAHTTVTPPCGQVLGIEGRSCLLNRRWRVVPEGNSLINCYEWELQSKSSKPGSPFTLKIFQENGREVSRNARCPLFLDNYISLDSPNEEGVDEIFRDNTICYLDDKTCTLQNTWFTGAVESRENGPLFLDHDIPRMRSVIVDKDALAGGCARRGTKRKRSVQ
jgi:hypothetical protein